MRIALLETSAPGSAGSMTRYADLIEAALTDVEGISLQRVYLLPQAATSKPWPRVLQTAMYHGRSAWNARAASRSVMADVFHVVDGSMGHLVHRLPYQKTVVTAHDVIPELQARGRFAVPGPSRLARQLIRWSLSGVAAARCVMADSACTARDLIEVANVSREKVAVTPLALPQDIQPRDKDVLSTAMERRVRPFLLHLGNNGFYKNRRGAVRIAQRVREQRPDVRMVLAGPKPDDGLLAEIGALGLSDAVDVVVNPTDAQVKAFYREASVFLFPSMYEGFGWPPLEAMAWRCPVVASCEGSLPEVVGAAGLTAPAADEAALAQHCLSILNNAELAETLAQAGCERLNEFSVERFRERILHVYRTVAHT